MYNQFQCLFQSAQRSKKSKLYGFCILFTCLVFPVIGPAAEISSQQLAMRAAAISYLGLVNEPSKLHTLVALRINRLFESKMDISLSELNSWINDSFNQLEDTGISDSSSSISSNRHSDTIDFIIYSAAKGQNSHFIARTEEEISFTLNLLFETDNQSIKIASIIYLDAWLERHRFDIWFQLLQQIGNSPEFHPLIESAFSPIIPTKLHASDSQWQDIADQALFSPPRGAAKNSVEWMTNAINLLATIVNQSTKKADPFANYNHNIAVQKTALLAYLGQQNISADDAHQRAWRLLLLADELMACSNFQCHELLNSIHSLLLDHIRNPLGDLKPIQSLLKQYYIDNELKLAWADASYPAHYAQTLGIMASFTQQNTALTHDSLDSVSRLGNSHARLNHKISDLPAYLTQKSRAQFDKDMSACFSLSRETAELPPEPISDNQFRKCMSSLSEKALEINTNNYADGQSSRTFTDIELQEALKNESIDNEYYWHAYINKLLVPLCTKELKTNNRFDWSLAARSYLWMAKKWPSLASEYMNRQDLNGIIQLGETLISSPITDSSCDPANNQRTIQKIIAKALDNHITSLESLKLAFTHYQENFKILNLREDADISLDGSALQSTNYRPLDTLVGPCGANSHCGVSIDLPATRALFSQFPAAYLVADQSKLGSVSLCYSDVEWTNRKVEPTQYGTQAMGNYFGQLQFILVGIYQNEDTELTVFQKQLTSIEKFHYLFGANTESVLDDSCPRELIGEKIVAYMPETDFNVVPRRLTFLTADRQHPLRAFEQHWTKGEEWRDQFITGNNIKIIQAPTHGIIDDSVAQHLERLFMKLNADIYRQVDTDPKLTKETTLIPHAAAKVSLSLRILQSLADQLIQSSLDTNPNFNHMLYGHTGLTGFNDFSSFQKQYYTAFQSIDWAIDRAKDAKQLWKQYQFPEKELTNRYVDASLAYTLLKLYTYQDSLQQATSFPLN